MNNVTRHCFCCVILFFNGFIGMLQAKSINIENMPKNLVFFGDSWTDSGNYPEPANVDDPKIDNFNLYVPISNPVPNELYGTDNVPSKDFLQQSILEKGLINGQAKKNFSINWPLYLVYSLYPKSKLVSLINYKKNPNQTLEHLNYAWVGAVGFGEPRCTLGDYSIFQGECNINVVIERNKLYYQQTLKDPFYDKNTKYQYKTLLVPNLAMQVSMYLNDSSIPFKDDNVAYFVFTGSNDIAKYFHQNMKTLIINPITNINHSRINDMLKKTVDSVNISLNSLLSQIKKSSNNKSKIYLLSLPELSNLHKTLNYIKIPLIGAKIKTLIDYTVLEYNRQLKQLCSANNMLKFVDIGSIVNDLAKSEFFEQAIKQNLVCINDSAYVVPGSPANNNCKYADNKRGYLSWNNSHVTTEVHKKIADFVYKNL